MKRLVLVCGLAFNLAACACNTEAPPSKFPTADVALARMRATYACARGVQGEAKIDYMGQAGRLRTNLLLYVVDPDRVRFDVFSPFGVMLASLTSDGRKFSLFDMKNKSFLEGPPQPCNIARLTQVPIPAHALVRLMRGEAPVLTHAPGSATMEWSSCDGGFYELTVPSRHEAIQTIRLRPMTEDFGLPYQQQRVEVKYVRISQRDFVHYEAEMQEHKPLSTMPPRTDPMGLDPDIPPSGPACTASVPRRIHFTVPYKDNDVIFDYKEAGLNPPLPEGVFSQQMPGGVRRQYVSCD